MRVLGLDLSLARTGVACADGTLHSIVPKAGAKDPGRRLHEIITTLDPLIARGRPELAVIEGAAGVQQAQTALVLGELRGAVKVRLFEHAVAYVVVPPTSLKKWATGNGGASKDDMVARARDFGARPRNDDEADAFHLRRMGIEFGSVAAEASDRALLAWLKGGS